MNVLVRLLTFYELALRKLKGPLGAIFPYKGGATGLQMLAEFIARMTKDGIALMVFPSRGTESLTFIPSGLKTSGFIVDLKIALLQEDKHFVMLLQKEEHLSSGNYIALRIQYDGSKIELFHIKAKFNRAMAVSCFDLSYLDSHAEILQRAFQIVLEEVDVVME